MAKFKAGDRVNYRVAHVIHPAVSGVVPGTPGAPEHPHNVHPVVTGGYPNAPGTHPHAPANVPTTPHTYRVGTGVVSKVEPDDIYKVLDGVTGKELLQSFREDDLSAE